MTRLRNPLWALLLFISVTSVWALDPSQPVSSYIRDRFTGDDKFHLAVVNYMEQSRDGFLWLVHAERLVRFDGRQFTGLDQTLHVRVFALAPDGDLWVGTLDDLERIPAAALNQSGRLPATLYHPGPGLSSYIVCLHFTRSGVLWVGTAAGLYRFENNTFSLVMPGRIERIEEAANGHLLVSTSEGFVEWDGSRAVRHPELASQLGVEADKIYHVFEDSHGITWFCTGNGIARRIGGSMEKLAPWGPNGHGAFRVYEDPSGNVWFAGAEGLLRATATGLELAAAGMQVRYIYGDRDGDLWVGTNGDGLYRFKDRVVRMFTKADGLPNNTAMTVLATHDGAVWSGFNCGGIVRFDGKRFQTYNEKNGLLNSCVYSLAEDANHDLWIGTWGAGVFRFHDGHFTQYSEAQGLASNIARAVVAAHDGSVWVGSRAGVSRIRDGQIRNYTVADGLSNHGVRSIYEDRMGRIWAATAHGVFFLEGEWFVNFSSLPKSEVYPIGEDRSGGLYFSVYPDAGIYRLESNQIFSIASAPDMATMMVETEQKDLWLLGGRILRVPPGGLDHPHQGDDPVDFAPFGLTDGLTTTESSGGLPESTLTHDRKLWIATTQGLAMVDLRRLPSTDRKPSIYVEEIIVGRNTQPPGHELVLPAGTHHLELNFDAVEISSPEKIRLQYRLDSVDSEWLDAKQPVRATYSNIPPGKHAFHIRACNRSGIWDRTGIIYYITQQPYFYETTWFRLATVMAGLLLLWGLYRLRLRQATARVTTRLEGRLAERSRIARELHDTLLQSFQGVVFLFQGVTSLLPDGETKRRFEGALDQAEQAIIEGRDAVHEMRSSEAASELSAAIHAFAEELANAQTGKESPVIRMRVEGSPRTLTPILHDEIYRIAVEGLRNAFQHAQAHQIETEIIYGDRQLVLRVRDDGKGVDADILDHGRAGHFGLPGMRERAKLIGASLEVRSTAGSGTEVELAIASTIAYTKSPATRRWLLGRFRKN